MPRTNPAKYSTPPSQWRQFRKKDKPQKGIGLSSTFKESKRPKGLGPKGEKIYHLYDIAKTYPHDHNQREKIQSQMIEIFWGCKTSEQDKIEIKFLEDLLVLA